MMFFEREKNESNANSTLFEVTDIKRLQRNDDVIQKPKIGSLKMVVKCLTGLIATSLFGLIAVAEAAPNRFAKITYSVNSDCSVNVSSNKDIGNIALVYPQQTIVLEEELLDEAGSPQMNYVLQSSDFDGLSDIYVKSGNNGSRDKSFPGRNGWGERLSVLELSLLTTEIQSCLNPDPVADCVCAQYWQEDDEGKLSYSVNEAAALVRSGDLTISRIADDTASGDERFFSINLNSSQDDSYASVFFYERIFSFW